MKKLYIVMWAMLYISSSNALLLTPNPAIIEAMLISTPLSCAAPSLENYHTIRGSCIKPKNNEIEKLKLCSQNPILSSPANDLIYPGNDTNINFFANQLARKQHLVQHFKDNAVGQHCRNKLSCLVHQAQDIILDPNTLNSNQEVLVNLAIDSDTLVKKHYARKKYRARAQASVIKNVKADFKPALLSQQEGLPAIPDNTNIEYISIPNDDTIPETIFTMQQTWKTYMYHFYTHNASMKYGNDYEKSQEYSYLRSLGTLELDPYKLLENKKILEFFIENFDILLQGPPVFTAK